MDANDRLAALIAHNLRVALGLEIFVEFSFIAALVATAGAFSGGAPTTTPLGAQVYLVVGFLVTIVVIARTRQMIGVAQAGDLAALSAMHVRAWAIVALVFSAMLPSMYLFPVAGALPPRR